MLNRMMLLRLRPKAKRELSSASFNDNQISFGVIRAPSVVAGALPPAPFSAAGG